MADYKTYSVTILLENGGNLEKRIKRSAQERDISFESALQEAVDIGLWKHLEQSMDVVESAYRSTT